MTLVEELRSKKSRDNRDLLDRAADRIEELELLLINENKSNNFDVKSNKQIEEMAECCPYFWNGACTVDAANPTDCDLMCEMFGFMTSLANAGYRKQSEDMVSISTVKKWLYSIAINNVGCVLDGDFSDACEEIISRLYGLKQFAEDMKGGA